VLYSGLIVASPADLVCATCGARHAGPGAGLPDAQCVACGATLVRSDGPTLVPDGGPGPALTPTAPPTRRPPTALLPGRGGAAAAGSAEGPGGAVGAGGAGWSFQIEGQDVAIPGLSILEVIGQGGMGCVYRARHAASGRMVAVKVLSQKLATKESFVLRFRREARAQAQATHPNVVHVLDHGEHDGLFYMTMELVDGASLRPLIRGGRYRARELLWILIQTCRSVAHIHAQGLIHRDLKPENILLARTGTVKVGDFGLVDVMASDGTDANLTRTNTVLGTLNYMAPEQRVDASRVTPKADVYSMGVVFFELATGKLPLGRYDAPSRCNVLLDPRLDAPILSAMEVDPERRIAVGELLDTVEGIMASLTPDQLEANWGPATAAHDQARAQDDQLARGDRFFQDLMAARGETVVHPQAPDGVPPEPSATEVREAQFVGMWMEEREKRRSRDPAASPAAGAAGNAAGADDGDDERLERRLAALHRATQRQRAVPAQQVAESTVPAPGASEGSPYPEARRTWRAATVLLAAALLIGVAALVLALAQG
jgi:tRNA A-37 threonylcarbamoyl transferase component Bud32